MKLELDILELNDLYYATSKLIELREKDLKEYGTNVSSITYLKKELRKAEVLNAKVQKALYAKLEEIDEAVEYVNNMVGARKLDRVAGDLV
jgi:hypothetical protein